MSELLKVIVGQSVAPNQPKHDETPVPYRQTQQLPLTPVVEGPPPEGPSEADTPLITE